jgi:hypothetical protein
MIMRRILVVLAALVGIGGAGCPAPRLTPRPVQPTPASRPITPAARSTETEAVRIDAEIRRIDAELGSSSGREIVFPGRNTLGGSSTVFEKDGVVRKIVRSDFGETGKSTTTFYYRRRVCLFVLSEEITYTSPVNDYGNPDAGKPMTTVQSRYTFVRGQLVRYLKDAKVQPLPPRTGEKMLRDAAAELSLADRCQPRRPPCAGCTCETTDCRTLSCEEK